VVYCRDSKNEGDKISSISDVSQLSRAVISGYGNGQDDNTTGLIDFKTCYDAANKVFLFGRFPKILLLQIIQ
jgi:hypothetical protein